MRRLLPLLLLLALANTAHAADLAATPATFWGVITNTAKPGDVVHLTAGSYPDPKFYRVTKAAPGVLVRPQRGETVTLAGLSISATEGLTFEGLEVLGSVVINGSSRIEIRDLSIHSRTSDRPSGLTVRNSADITVRRNDISSVGAGIVLYANPVGRILVDQNNIHDIAGPDAIDSFSSSNVVISRNVIRDIAPAAGAHPDAIQIDSPVPGVARSTNVKVINNRYFKGTGEGSMAAQGVFAGHVDNLTIRGNELFGTMFNGISVSDVMTGLVEDNFVQGLPEYPTSIVTRGGSADVTVRGNTAMRIQAYTPAGTPPLVRYVEENNVKIPSAKNSDDTARRGAWRSLMEAKAAGLAPPDAKGSKKDRKPSAR